MVHEAHSSANETIPQTKEEWNKNLMDWHKDSHPLTKNEDGTPKGTFDKTNPNILNSNGGNSFGGALGGGLVGGMEDTDGDGIPDNFNYMHAVAGMAGGAYLGKKFGGQGAGLFAGKSAKGFDAKNPKNFNGKYDGMERFEIDDSVSKIPNKSLTKLFNEESVDLVDILKHDELYNNYPELKDVWVSLSDEPHKGSYFDGASIVVDRYLVNTADEQKLKSSLLHEIQHAIQTEEGFARGGSASEFYTNASKKIELLKYENEFEVDDFAYDRRAKQIQELEQKWNSGGKEEAFDMYQRLAGEIEARDVQARADYTAKQREEIAPYSSENIDVEDAILKFDHGNDDLRGQYRADMSPVKSKEQREMRGIYNVTFNGKNATEVRKADGDELIKYTQGDRKQGAVHIQKHLEDGSVGEVTTQELLNIGNVVRNGKLYESYGKNVYELEKDGVKFKVISGRGKSDDEKIITFYSNRNLEEKKGYEISLITNNFSSAKSITQNSQTFDDFAESVSSTRSKTPFDALEKLATKRASKGWSDISHNGETFESVKNSFKELFTDTLSGKYHESRDLVHTNMESAETKLTHLAKALEDFDDDVNRDLYRYLTKTGGEDLPDVVKKLGDDIRYTVDSLGSQLVEKGILDEKAYKEWAGAYLHRSYEKHLNNGGLFTTNKKIDRILERGVSKEFEQDDIKGITGWLNKNGYLQDDDLMKLRSLKDVENYLKANSHIGQLADGKMHITQNYDGKIKLRRDFTKAEREGMGEIESAKYAVPETLMRLNRMLEHAKFLERANTIDGVVLDAEKAKNLTNREIANLGFSKLDGVEYGALNGKYVRNDVADDIGRTYKDISNSHSELFRVWNEYHGLWKKSKTVWNPTAHVNNFAGNLFLMHLAGANVGTLAGALKNGASAMKKYSRFEELEIKRLQNRLSDAEKIEYIATKHDAQLVLEAKSLGVFGKGQLRDILAGIEPKAGQMGVLGKMDKFASNAYQAEDNFNRLSFYLTLRNAGKDAKTSKQMVDYMLPDYSKPLPKGWRVARDSAVAPFISWSYFTMPSIIKMLGTGKGAWQATKVVAMLSAMEYMTSGISLVDNMPFIDTDKPEDFKGRRFAYNKDGDKVSTIKLDRMIPYAELQNPINYAKSQVSGMLPNALYTMNGMQMYNGRPITYKNKDVTDKGIDWIKHLASGYTPTPAPMMSGINIIDSLAREQKRRKTNKVTIPKTTGQQVLQTVAGVNTYDYSLSEQKRSHKE